MCWGLMVHASPKSVEFRLQASFSNVLERMFLHKLQDSIARNAVRGSLKHEWLKTLKENIYG